MSDVRKRSNHEDEDELEEIDIEMDQKSAIIPIQNNNYPKDHEFCHNHQHNYENDKDNEK